MVNRIMGPEPYLKSEFFDARYIAFESLNEDRRLRKSIRGVVDEATNPSNARAACSIADATGQIRAARDRPEDPETGANGDE